MNLDSLVVVEDFRRPGTDTSPLKPMTTGSACGVAVRGERKRRDRSQKACLKRSVTDALQLLPAQLVDASAQLRWRITLTMSADGAIPPPILIV